MTTIAMFIQQEAGTDPLHQDTSEDMATKSDK